MNQEPFIRDPNDLSDENLRLPAQNVLDAMMHAVPREEDCEAHVFSLQFQAEMERLCTRERRRKAIRRWSKRAAMLLVCIVSIGAWFAVDTDAKASFMRWFREQKEDCVAYSFQGELDPNAEPMFCKEEYEPRYLPEGYQWTEASESDHRVITVYQKGEDTLEFGYAPQDTGEDWKPDISGKSETSVKIGEEEGRLFSGEGNSVLLWCSRNMGFYLSAPVNGEELLAVARSVSLSNAEELPQPDDYEIAQLPEGYTLQSEENEDGTCSRIYADEQGRLLRLCYGSPLRDPESTALENDVAAETVKVNDFSAKLYLSGNGNGENAVLWTNDDGVTFCLAAPLTREDLIGLAESVMPVYAPLYQPSWLPKSYCLEETFGDEISCTLICYNEETDQTLIFDCFYIHSGVGMSLYTPAKDSGHETVRVHGMYGDLYRSGEDDSVLMWFDEDTGVTFDLNGSLSKKEILKMAKSVERTK